MLLLLLPAHVAEYCNATSCYPCHYTCQICEGLLSTDCIGCLQDYVLKDGLCSPCGMNCMVCQTNPVDDSAYCQTCLSGFYLDQATQVCAPCPTGATSCTYSAIQQCSSSYFLWNSNCQPCIVNCLSCSSSSSCLTCLSGYQLTSGNTCISCVNTHCK